MMKRFTVSLLTAAMILGMSATAHAAAQDDVTSGYEAVEEAATGFNVGDKVENFTATLIDGTQVSLYDLLKEKKAVMINIWATWCGPCKLEFPMMEEVYSEMQDEIGVLALSSDPNDNAEKINAVREELGIKNIPMGVDTNDLYTKFQAEGTPTSVMIDRNGIICFKESGAILEIEQFRRLFKAFTADDYETTIYDAIPAPKFEGTWPTGDELKAALCPDLDVAFDEELNDGSYPFIPAEEGVTAANSSDKGTAAEMSFTINSEEAQKLGFSAKVNTEEILDTLKVYVDGEQVDFFTGSMDWRDAYVELGAAGEHEVSFVSDYSDGSSVEDQLAQIKNIHIVTDEEAAAIDANTPEHPVVLEGSDMKLEVLSDVQDVVYDDKALLGPYSEEDAKMRLVKDGTIKVRITVGPDVDIEKACVMGFTGKGAILANLPQDETGFVYTVNVEDLKNPINDTYGMERIVFLPFASDTESHYGQVIFNLTQASVDETLAELAQYSGMDAEKAASCWHYEDNYYPMEYSLLQ